MSELVVYDKVKWHLEGEGCPSPEAAMRHLKLVMDWLAARGYLSPDGQELYALGVDREFSLHSGMLTEAGNAVMAHCYDSWLETLTYDEAPSLLTLQHCAQELKSAH